MIVAKEKLPEFAAEVLQKIQKKPGQAFSIFLSGNLGSGKTTFMQSFAQTLGVMQQIQSPTYVLMKTYPIGWGGFTKLVHIDAYRLENGAEFGALKPEEFLHDPNNIVCIEWAENIHDVLPRPDLVLKFSSEGVGEGERNIEIREV